MPRAWVLQALNSPDYRAGGGCGHSLTHMESEQELRPSVALGTSSSSEGRTVLVSCPPASLADVALFGQCGWGGPLGGSRVGSSRYRWVSRFWCAVNDRTGFSKTPSWTASGKREIFHSHAHAVQMVFLKIYFCAFAMFLNNVSISTVEDKLRAVCRICLCIFLSVAGL